MAQPTADPVAFVEEQLATGASCFERGDHDAAIGVYTRALDALAECALAPEALAPLTARLYGQRGHSRFIKRDLTGALEDYGQAIAHDPELTAVYAYRGLIAYQTGKPIAAVADYDQAIRQYLRIAAPTPAQRQSLAEAYFNRGNAQYQRRAFANAELDYDAALALAPELLDALIYRGVARFQMGEYLQANDDYDRAQAQPNVTNPQRAVIFYNRGLLLRQQGDLAGAITAYSAALALEPHDADCLMNRGNARADQGDLEGAIGDYSAALRLNPWLDDGFNICGMARLLAGDLAGAIVDFERAIQRNPHAASVHFNRGCARLQIGDYTGAIDDFTTELGMHAPGLKGRVETREKRAEIYNNRGLAQHYLGNLDVAIADYDRSIDQLRLAGGVDQTGERMANTLLNRGMARRARAQAGGQSRDDELQAQADLEQALTLTGDPALVDEIRRNLNEYVIGGR